MADLTKLFGMQSSVREQNVVRNTDEYKVSYKDPKCKGGVYKSVIRFIPWYADPDNSLRCKTVSYVKNPITQQGMYVDDPRSVGQPSPIIDMFFKFRNTGIESLQNFGKQYISPKPQYTALVQIIQDDQHPELVGQIKVFRFGSKIYDKLYTEEHPQVGQGIIPFHPIYGRYFSLVCTSVAGFPNYDQSTFYDVRNGNQISPSGIWYVNPATNSYEVVTENTNQQAVADYLQSNSPDLNQYDYSPMTAEQEEFVNGVLQILANYLTTGNLPNNLQTINTPTSGLTMNTNPTFPGATPAAMPSSAPAPMPGVMPAPTPTPAPAPAPASTPNMGTFSMGSLNGVAAPVPTPAAPTIGGIELPRVEPATAPSAVPTIGGAISNVDDVLMNL